jgi:hypothetical protein
MNAYVLVCGNVFDGISDTLADPAEILVEGNRIARIREAWRRRPELDGTGGAYRGFGPPIEKVWFARAPPRERSEIRTPGPRQRVAVGDAIR